MKKGNPWLPDKTIDHVMLLSVICQFQRWLYVACGQIRKDKE